MTLEFLLRMHLRGAPGALDMVTRTLDRMANGGIHDQLGGGFHRYSVDGRWHVPHFEKMLYDNAQLARLYLHAHQVTGREPYRAVVVKTLDYLLREMRHPDGGFFSSQDADSEGVEGRFFVWSFDELVEVVGEGGEAVAAFFGALPEGNWDGTNVLWQPQEVGVVADQQAIPLVELGGRVLAAIPRLFEARERRIHPGTDDKILAAWNGLAIAALAEAARVLGRTAIRRGRSRRGRVRADAPPRRRGPAPALVAGRADERTRGSSTTTRCWPPRASSCTRRRSTRDGCERRARCPTSWSACSTTRRMAASSRWRPTPTRSC